jgi:polyphosphate kinase 2 (PPK2 family)
MYLPETLAVQLRQEVHNLEEEEKMRYVTSFERLAIQDGIQQGKSWLLQQMVAARFPQKDLTPYQRFIDSASDDQLLSYLFKTATAEKIEDVFND